MSKGALAKHAKTTEAISTAGDPEAVSTARDPEAISTTAVSLERQDVEALSVDATKVARV